MTWLGCRGPFAPRACRVAAVTLLRTQEYFPLMQQLECTLRKSNPGLELAVRGAPARRRMHAVDGTLGLGEGAAAAAPQISM